MYPLKAGWQQLPEFEIKYNTPDDVVPEKRADEEANNLQLKMLVHRWMPKRVFILVSRPLGKSKFTFQFLNYIFLSPSPHSLWLDMSNIPGVNREIECALNATHYYYYLVINVSEYGEKLLNK